ncbi:MAG: hypothetical protein WC758_04675 [Candidatus Woesearchaeota archaeon]|jgi:hypothetical protein
MYTQLKEGKQYSFSINISPENNLPQNTNQMISFFERTIHKKQEALALQTIDEIEIPISIFKTGESGLRAIVAYLKDEKKLTIKQISQLLGRDPRTIWTTYNLSNSKKNQTKQNKNLKNKKNQSSKNISNNYDSQELSISTKIFKERNLSVLETLSNYLLKTNSVKDVSNLLGKNQMTIWTVKRRFEEKLNKEKNKEKNLKKLTTKSRARKK